MRRDAHDQPRRIARLHVSELRAMLTKIVEATQGDGWTNHGKFMLMRFDEEEWARRSTVGPPQPLLDGVCGWGPEHLWVLDLQTGEGACFRPGGYATAHLDKHAVWVCPLFEPFVDWLWGQVRAGVDPFDLPERVELPD